jgi:p-cumate 2,3-dioxygenase beta subunit
MNNVNRTQVEDLLFDEAALLDSWKLKDWLQLYTPDAEYEVPSTELPRDADPRKSLFYIADDFTRLEQRVIRLGKRTMWSEYPRSRTRHLVSNVRVTAQNGDEVRADAAFAVYRTKWGNTDVFIGSYDYTLRRTEQGLRIRKKRCTLDLDGLRPQGRVSILL